MSEVKENTYWKSLSELAQNKEYKKLTEREFPENATELTDGVSRRGFLRVMGASIALAGLAACRRPVQKILPYAKQPEDIVAGNPLFYATAMPYQGNLIGLVAENREGRPTKLEGNPLHPASLGSTNIFNQAAVLELYDPDRSRTPLHNGQQTSIENFAEFAASHFSNTNQRIAFISEANSSPTYNGLKQQALNRFNNASWVTYEPFGEDNAIEGNRIAFGQRLRSYYHFENANVVVSLNDDFMSSTHPNNIEYARKVTAGRKLNNTEDQMNRIYAVEDSFSPTGSYADHRLKIKASEVEAFTYALASELSGRVSGLNAFSGYSNQFSNHQWISVLADELVANAGSSVVSVGYEHNAQVHAAVGAINAALGNVGNTVSYLEVPHFDNQDNQQAFADTVNQMKAGNIDTVVLVGTNPVFSAPADLGFEDALSNVDTVVHLSNYVDETSKKATWHVNRAHFLEAWGDGFSYQGTRSVIQPQIQPLHKGISEIEFLSTILTGNLGNGYELVQETFRGYYSSGFNNQWRQILHDGVDTQNNFNEVSVSLATSTFNTEINSALENASDTASGIEVVIRPDHTIYDGRFANLGWLQELPDPMTKITWDNVALMSPDTASELGVENEDVIEINANGNTVKIAAWIQPGHVDGSVTVTTGYGREGIGRVANSYIDYTAGGVDVYPLRTTSNQLFASAQISKTGESYEIACTQDHHSLEGRDMYRQATIDQYKENPEFATFKSVHGYGVPGMKEAHELEEDQPISLFDEQEYPNPISYPEYEPQWGMAIDLSSCFGCNACVIACQSENNIPVIGKKEVKRGRAMHWIRNDRYFVGDDVDNPQAVHQPVPCMHCELAPCEEVCPVAATTHSEDGINQMTYNRCIGTRYCENNCPYKVRRFNFFNYTKEYLTTGDDPNIVQMAMNPEVSVRFRGVMEKCTYCVQRINRAKIDAKIKTGSPKPEDGTVQTACQQACPTEAITFGDLTDENSVVSRAKSNNRNYQMLEELNTRPRTSYLAKVTNPNPALA